MPPTPAPPDARSSAPRRIGPYLIIEKIGAGGTARIFRAHDPGHNREVAIKVQATHLQGQPGVRQRFEREARTLMQFKHPHILPVFDYGVDGVTPYIVMQLLGGRTLNDMLLGLPLAVREVGRLTRQIASALDYAHARGIIHRDIKPHNILFDDQEKPYLADFGIAYLSGANATQRLTTAGQFVGTAAYASPEQCRGENLDRASDIYSLAVMVFEMVTGRLPFESRSSIALMKMHMSEPPPNPLRFNPNLPLDLYAVLIRALAKLPEHRYPSAMRFSEELDAALGLHAIPQASEEDTWLHDDLTPVDTDVPLTGPVSGDSPASNPTGSSAFFADDLDDLFDNPATDRDVGATVAGDPLAGIDLAAEFRLDDDPAPAAAASVMPAAPARPAAPAAQAAGVFTAAFDAEQPIPGGSFPFDDPFAGIETDTGVDAGNTGADGFDDDPFEVVPGAWPGSHATTGAAQPDSPAPPAHTTRPPLQSLHTLRQVRARQQQRTRQRRIVLYTIIAVAVVIIAASGLLLMLNVTSSSRAEPDTLLTSPELGVTLRYPAGWSLPSALLPVIASQPGYVQLIADQPVPAAGPYSGAALVIAVQRISPVQVFGVPPICQSRIVDGPAATFQCQRDSNLPAPVFERLTSTRYPSVQLPGSLPPTRATMPIVLVADSDSSWLALAIVHWDDYDDARGLLIRIAETVRPQT